MKRPPWVDACSAPLRASWDRLWNTGPPKTDAQLLAAQVAVFERQMALRDAEYFRLNREIERLEQRCDTLSAENALLARSLAEATDD